MNTTNRDGGVEPAAPEIVSCKVCETELPSESAVAFEAEDYRLWFCSNECYAQWQRGQPEKSKK